MSAIQCILVAGATALNVRTPLATRASVQRRATTPLMDEDIAGQIAALQAKIEREREIAALQEKIAQLSEKKAVPEVAAPAPVPPPVELFTPSPAPVPVPEPVVPVPAVPAPEPAFSMPDMPSLPDMPSIPELPSLPTIPGFPSGASDAAQDAVAAAAAASTGSGMNPLMIDAGLIFVGLPVVALGVSTYVSMLTSGQASVPTQSDDAWPASKSPTAGKAPAAAGSTGGSNGKSAQEIFTKGLENLSGAPTGWLFGEASPLYSNVAAAPAAPVMGAKERAKQEARAGGVGAPAAAGSAAAGVKNDYFEQVKAEYAAKKLMADAPPVAQAKPVAAAPVAAAPVAATPVAATPVAATPVAATPVAAKPVAAVPVAATPVAATPVAATPVAAKPVAAVPVAAKPVAATPVAAVPVAAVPVAAVPVAAAVAATPVAEEDEDDEDDDEPLTAKERMSELKGMLDDGLVSAEEYESARQAILESL